MYCIFNLSTVTATSCHCTWQLVITASILNKTFLSSIHPSTKTQKEPQVVKNSRTLHYSVSHNRTMVLGHKAPKINKSTQTSETLNAVTKLKEHENNCTSLDMQNVCKLGLNLLVHHQVPQTILSIFGVLQMSKLGTFRRTTTAVNDGEHQCKLLEHITKLFSSCVDIHHCSTPIPRYRAFRNSSYIVIGANRVSCCNLEQEGALECW